MSGGHARVSFRPVVRDGVSEDVAVSVERSCRDGTGRWVESCLSRRHETSESMIKCGKVTFQPRTGILVPEVNGAVRTLRPVSVGE